MIFRFWAHAKARVKAPDDIVITLAWLCSLALTIILNISSLEYGWNRHFIDIPLEWIESKRCRGRCDTSADRSRQWGARLLFKNRLRSWCCLYPSLHPDLLLQTDCRCNMDSSVPLAFALSCCSCCYSGLRASFHGSVSMQVRAATGRKGTLGLVFTAP